MKKRLIALSATTLTLTSFFAGCSVHADSNSHSSTKNSVTVSSHQTKPYTLHQRQFPNAYAAMNEILQLEHTNWEVNSSNPPVAISSGIKAQFIGGAGQSQYKWKEGDWTVIAKFSGDQATTQKTVEGIANDIQVNGLIRVHSNGLIVIIQNGESGNSFSVMSAWQKGNTVWTFEEKGNVLQTLGNIRKISS